VEAIPIGSIGPDPGGHLEQHPVGEHHEKRRINASCFKGQRLIMVEVLQSVAVQPWVGFQPQSVEPSAVQLCGVFLADD
jgi:hypothetical protein